MKHYEDMFLEYCTWILCFQDKQEGHRQKMREQVQTPEAVPRLYDLVKTQDDRLKLAFFAVLGNTVVAKDLDQVDKSFV